MIFFVGLLNLKPKVVFISIMAWEFSVKSIHLLKGAKLNLYTSCKWIFSGWSRVPDKQFASTEDNSLLVQVVWTPGSVSNNPSTGN